ncbi:DNA cross-link repair protein pso2/snm1-related [Anaeramoeba ignava]|uniref:DNA cross-link repair protein pso2/snm1-related n=1 Tax=Anaeramoeba ignava TaxID=1746090 RepID=A0A9Q0LKB2_ANAIG|nr:DNA cross-link repair protein pso2/snm1-related [Anaeramoeba ignava]
MIPLENLVPGTTFVVDYFDLSKKNISLFFFTQFHPQVNFLNSILSSNNSFKICCHPITKILMMQFHNFKEDSFLLIEYYKKINFSGVEITCLNSNYCPGSSIFLFKLKNGKVILHTGLFRFTKFDKDCDSLVRLRNENTLDYLFLDSTFCLPKFQDFLDQKAIAEYLENKIISLNQEDPNKIFLFATDILGNEKFAFEFVQKFQKKLYVDSQQLELIQSYSKNKQYKNLIIKDPTQTNFHFCFINDVTFDLLDQFCESLNERMEQAISKQFFNSEKNKNHEINRICLSYHCSYSELTDFLDIFSFIQEIVPLNIEDNYQIRRQVRNLLLHKKQNSKTNLTIKLTENSKQREKIEKEENNFEFKKTNHSLKQTKISNFISKKEENIRKIELKSRFSDDLEEYNVIPLNNPNTKFVPLSSNQQRNNEKNIDNMFIESQEPITNEYIQTNLFNFFPTKQNNIQVVRKQKEKLKKYHQHQIYDFFGKKTIEKNKTEKSVQNPNQSKRIKKSKNYKQLRMDNFFNKKKEEERR